MPTKEKKTVELRSSKELRKIERAKRKKFDQLKIELAQLRKDISATYMREMADADQEKHPHSEPLEGGWRELAETGVPYKEVWALKNYPMGRQKMADVLGVTKGQMGGILGRALRKISHPFRGNLVRRLGLPEKFRFRGSEWCFPPDWHD